MKNDPGSTVQGETRRLAAIMFTDIVGFSRQMGSDEARMLRLMDVHNRIIQQAVSEHHGTVIKTVGDGFLVDFPSVVHAVQCAQSIQAQFRTHNAEKETTEQIHVRIGIHLGDIVQRDGDVFGDGVNIASRLQALAEPDAVCLSQAVYKEIEKKLLLGTVISLGKPYLKNIAERFPVYALLSNPPQGFRQKLRVRWLQLSHRVGTSRRIAAAVLVLALVSTGALLLKDRYFPSYSGLPLPDKPSIVVLPFVNMSEDPKQEYFSDGLTEVLTSDLSRLSELFVIARNSAFTYKGKTVNVREVSQELGVQYVLEGSVQRAADRVRIAVQLIDATTGYQLWSERYDRPFKDIFALQDEVVQKIRTTLQLQLTLWKQGTLVRKRTDNLEAYDYYLRGLGFYYRFTKEASAQARQLFEKAIALDPQYAEAYAWLGLTYYLERLLQWSQDLQVLERAFALAQQAVVLEDSLPYAHLLLSQVYLGKRQYEQAITEAEQTVALDPNSARGYAALGVILNFMGQGEKAIGVIERGLRLDPRSPFVYQGSLGWAYFLTRRYEEAIAVQKKILSHNRNWLDSHLVLTLCYSELGQEEARAEAAEVLRLSPNYSLEVIRQTWPIKDPAQLERILAALRKAGLK